MHGIDRVGSSQGMPKRYGLIRSSAFSSLDTRADEHSSRVIVLFLHNSLTAL